MPLGGRVDVPHAKIKARVGGENQPLEPSPKPLAPDPWLSYCGVVGGAYRGCLQDPRLCGRRAGRLVRRGTPGGVHGPAALPGPQACRRRPRLGNRLLRRGPAVPAQGAQRPPAEGRGATRPGARRANRRRLPGRVSHGQDIQKPSVRIMCDSPPGSTATPR